MINKIHLQRFKCFNDEEIIFRNLTLLAGSNATGKSTVIQSLLLLRQAYLKGSLQKGELPLNGSLVNIGTIRDAYYVNGQIDSFEFTIWESEHISIKCTFKIEQGLINQYIAFGKSILKRPTSSILFSNGFTYLQAERLGPRLLYPMTELIPSQMDIGTQGEFTSHLLSIFGEESIRNQGLIYPNSQFSSLSEQTKLWMQRIIPSFDFQVEDVRKADMVGLGLRNRTSTSDFFLRPTNIGFGVSYVLPIIVSALHKLPGDLLIIENPEAHLHPQAQSEMGRFLARVASSGIQVIIETHSDHILNGIRIGVRRGEITSNEISLQFFTNSEEKRVITPELNSEGYINVWPDGFFDQMEKDLMELF